MHMDLQFNPNRDDIFCANQVDVAFYRLNLGKLQSNCEEVRPSVFLKKDSESSDVKCMQWHPSQEYSNIIAFGYSNGRVVLNSAETDHRPSFTLSGKEFISKNQKQCCDLAWNKFKNNWLAIGHDRHGRQNCLMVWDVLAKSTSENVQTTSERSKSLLDASISSGIVPVVEYGIGESVNSVTWSDVENASILLTGMGKKIIRLFDVRIYQQASSPSFVQHKATFGLCIDPLFENRLASFHDSSIVTWDLRYFTKPVCTLTTVEPIKKIEWSSTRKGLLGALLGPTSETSSAQVEGSSLVVYDMVHLGSQDSDSGCVANRDVTLKFPEGDWVTGFAWHRSMKNRLLACSSGSSFCMSTITERTSVACSATGKVALACQEAVYSSKIEVVSKVEDGTLSQPGSLLRSRATNLYGLHENAKQNFALSLEPGNSRLENLWNLLEIAKKANKLNPRRASAPQINSPKFGSPWSSRGHKMPVSRSHSVQPRNECLSGILAMLEESSDSSGEPNAGKSTSENVSWIGVNATKTTVYTSSIRDLALAICGWTVCDHAFNLSELGATRFGPKGTGERLVRVYQEAGHVTRACAIAVWHLDIRLAIDILREPNPKLQLGNHVDHDLLPAVAMALSGYSAAGSPTLWQETCRRLQGGLSDPYLQSAFSFLLANSDERKAGVEGQAGKFDAILDNKALLIQDRIAFSLIYLPDSLLHSYLSRTAQEVTLDGAIDGWIVTGVCTESGIELMQNYIDQTLDLQTVLSACMLTNDPTFLKDDTVQYWKDSYCQLLNSWQLFTERVEFNLAWAKACKSTKPSAQVYIYCNFCNKSVSTAGKSTALASRGRFAASGSLAMQSSVTSCPSCRKPLPRCSICSMHVGSRPGETDSSKWISWCMKCRHGGHTDHLREWFEEFRQCPVYDCKCQCATY